MTEPSLQRYAPLALLRLRPGQRARPPDREPSSADGATASCRATWQPLPHHAAFENVLNGGIIGTLLDCHANWTAAMHLMRERGLAGRRAA